jgi:hypothetical protein
MLFERQRINILIIVISSRKERFNGRKTDFKRAAIEGEENIHISHADSLWETNRLDSKRIERWI